MSGELRVAVLIKQVPLVEGIGEPMKLGPDGRLVRHGIELEINPFCRRAITKGVELVEKFGGRCLVATLGPPSAEDSLREAIAAGATEAVLISDPAFAGSDTLATARALAALLEREGPFDLVLCGLYSVDADTGQVGPELAELLGLPFVSGARELDYDGERLFLDCERDDGLARAEVALPAVVSVAERLTYPAKRSPEERAAVPAEKLRRIDAATLGAGPWGQAGSPTTVGEIRVTESPRLRRRLEGSLEAQLDMLFTELAARGALEVAFGEERAEVPPMGGDRPEVFVLVEPERPRLSRELLGGAARLAAELGGSVLAVRVVGVLTDNSEDLGTFGADRVVALVGMHGREPGPEDVAKASYELVGEYSPSVVLASSTTWGREVASRLAARLGAGLTGDASSLEVRAGRLLAWKPAFGGQLEAAITASSPVQLATVRPGALAMLARREKRAVVTTLEVESTGRVAYSDYRLDEASDRVASAPVLVGIGAGIDPERYAEVEELAALLSGELVATRKVTDKSLLPRTRQIGLTGQHVGPNLYIAIGISGKVNHTVGLRRARTIVAVNPDPEAPIFESCDFGIVGEFETVVPAMLRRIEKGRSSE